MSIKDRLIQFVLRGKDELSPEAKKSAEALAAVSAEAEELGKVLDSAKDARGLARGLETTQRAAERAESGLVQADLQIKELRDALNKSPGSAGLEQSLKDAEREARRMQRGLDALRVSLADQEKAAQAAGIDTNNLADEEKRLAAEVDKAKVALDANSQQLKVLQREQASAARAAAEHTSRIDAARGAMSSGAKQVLAFAAAYISLDAAFGLVQKGLNVVRDGIYSMLKTGDQFELLDKRLASLMGSVAGGERATAWIKKFAKDTPLEVAEVTEAFALLKTYGLDPMDGTLQAVVDKNEELGGGLERLTGIASALGQAYGKQKLQTEEILQLVERGVPVWSMLEKVTGKNAAQLAELATQGKLGRDVIKALIAEIGKSAQGAAASSMGTLTGLASNLSDTWSGFLDRIADSGALDYVKGRLMALADTIDQMDKDGRLDALAASLGKAFVDGASKAEEFAQKLLKVDFNTLIDDSTKWLNGFGTGVDTALARFDAFTATTRGFWNALTIAGSSADTLFATVKLGILEVAGLIANVLPESIGGTKLKAAVADMSATVKASLKDSVAGVKTDAEDLKSVFSGIGADAADAAKTAAEEQTAAVKSALDQQRMLDQAHADQLIANQGKVKDAALAAAASGVAAITDIGNAINLIDTASSVEQLEGLRGALLKAFQDGRITQEQYAQATGLLNGKLGELGGAADDTGDALSGLSDEFGDMASIMRGVGSAMNEVDFNRLRAGIRKAYGDGKISAEEFAKAQAELNKRITELKPAADKGTKALGDQRKAIDENMQAARRGVADVGDAAEGASGGIDFFGSVLTAARTPLANMSKAALALFDTLRGIKNTDIELDVSSAEKTAAALAKVRAEALGLQAELGLIGSRDWGFGTWMRQTALASREVQAQYLEQKLRLQELMAGYEAGSIGLADFTRRAGAARQGLGLLDESDLSSLEGALDAARQKMEALGESTRGTLEGLQMELLQLQGTQEEIERAKFASRRNDLLTQQADAQQAGDSAAVANLARALRTLNEIEDVSTAKRQQAEQQKRAEELAKAAPAATAPGKVIRLESARGKAVDVAVNSVADETKLLGILEEAGLRSL